MNEGNNQMAIVTKKDAVELLAMQGQIKDSEWLANNRESFSYLSEEKKRIAEENLKNDLLMFRQQGDFGRYKLGKEETVMSTYRDGLISRDNTEVVANDPDFAIFDLAWKMRMEDAYGNSDLRKKVEEMVREHGERSGFVWACFLLNLCASSEKTNLSSATLDEDDFVSTFDVPGEFGKNRGEPIFVGELSDKAMVLSGGLQDLAVEYIGNYLSSGEKMDDGDVEELTSMLNRTLVFSSSWEDDYLEKSVKDKTALGDGYLDASHIVKLYEAIKTWAENNSEMASKKIKVGGVDTMGLGELVKTYDKKIGEIKAALKSEE